MHKETIDRIISIINKKKEETSALIDVFTEIKDKELYNYELGKYSAYTEILYELNKLE